MVLIGFIFFRTLRQQCALQREPGKHRKCPRNLSDDKETLRPRAQNDFVRMREIKRAEGRQASPSGLWRDRFTCAFQRTGYTGVLSAKEQVF
jgi:hypothetical protein